MNRRDEQRPPYRIILVCRDEPFKAYCHAIPQGNPAWLILGQNMFGATASERTEIGIWDAMSRAMRRLRGE